MAVARDVLAAEGIDDGELGLAFVAPDESRALLGHLTARATDPNVQLRHTWRVGDVAIWDERCTQHFAVADFVPLRRETARVNVSSSTR